MTGNGKHEVPRIDDTVTSANLHERAERVAIPDFDWLVDPLDAVVGALVRMAHLERPTSVTGPRNTTDNRRAASPRPPAADGGPREVAWRRSDDPQRRGCRLRPRTG
jgi:hypothetical protein